MFNKNIQKTYSKKNTHRYKKISIKIKSMTDRHLYISDRTKQTNKQITL